MATIQIRIDDSIKTKSDQLFKKLGIDTSTAVRMFLIAAIEKNGIPFDISFSKSSIELWSTTEEIQAGMNKLWEDATSE
ncbi:MAG: type II toxin-antitoxin system RelB/DinJ family antitoxin [Oscillospiraceae bacterium]|nr:type II toxin-antitoxin system RelB/DinJ family antitoxin [Oscillospiraceae bacterium]